MRLPFLRSEAVYRPLGSKTFTVVSQSNIYFRKNSISFHIAIHSTNSKKKSVFLLRINVLQLRLKQRQIILLRQKKTGTQMKKTSTDVETAVRCNQCCKTRISKKIVFDWGRVSRSIDEFIDLFCLFIVSTGFASLICRVLSPKIKI